MRYFITIALFFTSYVNAVETQVSKIKASNPAKYKFEIENEFNGKIGGGLENFQSQLKFKSKKKLYNDSVFEVYFEGKHEIDIEDNTAETQADEYGLKFFSPIRKQEATELSLGGQLDFDSKHYPSAYLVFKFQTANDNALKSQTEVAISSEDTNLEAKIKLTTNSIIFWNHKLEIEHDNSVQPFADYKLEVESEWNLIQSEKLTWNLAAEVEYEKSSKDPHQLLAYIQPGMTYSYSKQSKLKSYFKRQLLEAKKQRPLSTVKADDWKIGISVETNF